MNENPRTANRSDNFGSDALAILPPYLYRLGQVSAWLDQQRICPDCVQTGYADKNQPDFRCNRLIAADTPQDRQQLTARLDRYQRIIVITPSLDYIFGMAENKDDRFDVQLALRPLLWQRSVTMLLDFELPRHRRAFARLAESLDILEQMGMSFERLTDPEPEVDSRTRDLITARDVENARKQGQAIKASPNAIITPLARDAAKELGVIIE